MPRLVGTLRKHSTDSQSSSGEEKRVPTRKTKEPQVVCWYCPSWARSGLDYAGWFLCCKSSCDNSQYLCLVEEIGEVISIF
eukprot:3940871-Pleurochrysis_carterae.AAC.4